MPENLTPSECLFIHDWAKAGLDVLTLEGKDGSSGVYPLIRRLCIAYAERELTLASERATRFDERPKVWQSTLNTMRGER